MKDIYRLNTSVRLKLATGQVVYAHIGFFEDTNNVDATIKQIADGKVEVLGFGRFSKEYVGKWYPVKEHEELRVMGVKFKKNTITSVSFFYPDAPTICLHYTNDEGKEDSCSIGLGHLEKSEIKEYIGKVFAQLNIKNHQL